jgi:hypothetical protein
MTQATATINGDPHLVDDLSRLLNALQQSVTQTATDAGKHTSELDGYWQSKGADQAKLALGSAQRHISQAEHPIAQAAALLKQYSQYLAGAQQGLNAAVNQLNQLQNQLASNPGDATLQQEVTRATQQINTLLSNHQQHAQQVAHALGGLGAPPLPVTPKGKLTAIDALLLDDAVTKHILSKQGASKAASKIASQKGSQAATLAGLLASSSAKNEAKIMSMLAAGKSVTQINNTVGNAQYYSLSGPGQKLNGKVSWFGGPKDTTSTSTTASGKPVSVPGIAVYNQSTLGGYWLVQFPNGKKLVLQQTDIGPAPWTGRVIDVTYSALPAAGYSTGNFPTDSTVHARYLGKSVPPGVAVT